MFIISHVNENLITPTTTKELKELLALAAPKPRQDADYRQLRYVIYARKSTTGDERQERSIPDQVRDCMEKVVKVHNLRVVGDPIEEKCSAKEPDLRPKFKQVLEDVRAGRIDGIISWHPDRLSRNMKEAGEIIDLLDKGTLQDLRFATSTFENSPTGKMLLGISFVLSKQYSEHLSESVTRGNTHKIEEGKFFGKFKHGYALNRYGELHPDGNNFSIIQQAFQKRLEGMSQVDIATWLNSSGYEAHKKVNVGSDDEKLYEYKHVSYVWDKDAVSKVLKDPLFAGVLKYGDALCNLEEFYDFIPVVSVEDFFKINKISSFNSDKLVSSIMANKKRDTTKADLLRGMVHCGYCGKSFSSGLTSKILAADKENGKKTFYYNYKCETDGCEFKNKSVRANKVLTCAYEILEEYLFTTNDNYADYLAVARSKVSEDAKALRSELMSLTRYIGEKRKEFEQAKSLILESPDMKKYYNLDELDQQRSELEAQYKELSERLGADKAAILTYEQYLELFSSISVKLRQTHDLSMIDQVLRKFFSNFTVTAVGKGAKQRCDIDYKLKEPWQGFLENENFDRGRGERTRTFGLTVPNRARYQLRHTPIGVT